MSATIKKLSLLIARPARARGALTQDSSGPHSKAWRRKSEARSVHIEDGVYGREEWITHEPLTACETDVVGSYNGAVLEAGRVGVGRHAVFFDGPSLATDGHCKGGRFAEDARDEAAGIDDADAQSLVKSLNGGRKEEGEEAEFIRSADVIARAKRRRRWRGPPAGRSAENVPVVRCGAEAGTQGGGDTEGLTLTSAVGAKIKLVPVSMMKFRFVSLEVFVP